MDNITIPDMTVKDVNPEDVNLLNTMSMDLSNETTGIKVRKMIALVQITEQSTANNFHRQIFISFIGKSSRY